LYEGISVGLSPERIKLNPNKTLRKDQWGKKEEKKQAFASAVVSP